MEVTLFGIFLKITPLCNHAATLYTHFYCIIFHIFGLLCIQTSKGLKQFVQLLCHGNNNTAVKKGTLRLGGMDKYTISILAIKGWQEIWAKNYNDLHLRITFEYLIKSELLWLNQDFKQFIAKQDTGKEFKFQSKARTYLLTQPIF